MGRCPVARHKYSFPLVKNQRSDFATNHRAPQFLEIGIKNNGLGRGTGSGPAFLGPAVSDACPPPHGGPHSITDRSSPGEVTGKERGRQWQPPPRRGRQGSLVAADPGRRPRPQMPRKTWGDFRTTGAAGPPQRPILAPASWGAAPSGEGRGREEKWVSRRGAPVAGRAGGRRVGSSGRSWGSGGLARPSLPAPRPRRPRSPPGTYGGRGPQARRGSAGGGGGWGEAPVAELRKRSRVAVGRGPGSRSEGLGG